VKTDTYSFIPQRDTSAKIKVKTKAISRRWK